MTAPTIHLNGTSKESLIDGYCHARQALSDAYTALRETAPNGRDYYVVQPPGAWAAATAEHLDRLGRIDTIIEELEQLIGAVDNQ